MNLLELPIEYALVIEWIMLAAETGDIEDLKEAHYELNKLIDSKL